MELPLFPLKTVLFPGCRLELRLFEPRYLDMVRDCMRNQVGFGICMILQGNESGLPPVPAAVGTLAQIVDFCTLADGLLGITVEGGVRFRIESTHVADNGLMIGEVSKLSNLPPPRVPAEHALLVTLLERLADQEDSLLAAADKASFDDADWVGFQLADRLPIELFERQLVLEVDDPIARLDQLTRWLPRFQRD